VHHAEQPSLTRIGDVGARREDAARRRADVARLSDLAIDVVDLRVEVDERIDDLVHRHLAVEVQLVGARSEARSAQEVLDLTIGRSRHTW
jgi:hypothetical protein